MSSPNGDNNSTPSSPQVTPSTPVVVTTPQHDPYGPPGSSTIIALNAGSQISIKLSADSTNYPTWRVQFNALLVGYGLKGYIDGIKPCPAKYCDDACITIDPN
ncbi:hypothetical protein SESBI_02468 [Sesbania bispinosa]|nr:hypothetical protein SESBI_02468 [Sesbania bispinosa]